MHKQLVKGAKRGNQWIYSPTPASDDTVYLSVFYCVSLVFTE